MEYASPDIRRELEGKLLAEQYHSKEEAVKADAEKTEDNMADFFDADAGVKAKLVSAEWGVEEYRAQLFGRIECSLKEAVSEKEDMVLRDWICGQNADGWGEHFEQIPIDTEEGDLYVSFWYSENDHSIMTHDDGFDAVGYIGKIDIGTVKS